MRKTLNYISEIYIFIMILLFPFVIDKNRYFNILECKYDFYFFITTLYLIINSIVCIFYNFKIREKYDYKLVNIHFIALVLFLEIIISTFHSPYLHTHNFFIGGGRYEGIITYSLYIFSFINLSLYLNFDKKYFKYFIYLGIVMGIIIILQFLGFNPFFLYQYNTNLSYVGMIGNVDTVAALFVILLTISFYMYSFQDDKCILKFITFISTIICFFVIILINVQSGILTMILLFIIVFPFIISNSNYLLKLLKLLMFITFIVLLYKKYIIIGIGLSTLIFIFICYLKEKCDYSFTTDIKKIKKIFVIMFWFLILFLLIIYILPIKNNILYEFSEIMHGNFNDKFGNYRVFLWKRTIPLIKNYPFFGSGPDTFSYQFMAKYTNDIISIGPYSINDTAANIYLTNIINIGLVGLFLYVYLLITIILKLLKRKDKNSLLFVLIIVMYSFQAFFNFSVVIVSPIFWIILAYSCSYLKT